MKHLLSPEQTDLLREVRRSRALLGFDYDGTLAPISARPEEARMPPRTRELLNQAARRFPCVVVSGRGQQDLMRRLRGVPVREMIGNHGLEPRRYSDAMAARVREWATALRASLAPLTGVEVEDKIFSVAIHFRNAPDPEAARRLVRAAVADLREARVIGGKMVVNLVPAGAPDKGEAIEAARQRLGCPVAMYVGDDETDEDVFRAAAHAPILPVRVGEAPDSAAHYFLRAQEEIDQLLERLVAED